MLLLGLQNCKRFIIFEKNNQWTYINLYVFFFFLKKIFIEFFVDLVLLL